MNHAPTNSANIIMMAERTICILMLVQKILFNRILFPRPNSKVMKREIELVSDAETNANMATNPPTTLYIP